MKDAHTLSPILHAPHFSQPFELHSDWAKTGLRVVLNQRDDKDNEYIVAYDQFAYGMDDLGRHSTRKV